MSAHCLYGVQCTMPQECEILCARVDFRSHHMSSARHATGRKTFGPLYRCSRCSLALIRQERAVWQFLSTCDFDSHAFCDALLPYACALFSARCPVVCILALLGIELWTRRSTKRKCLVSLLLSVYPLPSNGFWPKRSGATCTVSILCGSTPGDVHVGFHSASDSGENWSTKRQ